MKSSSIVSLLSICLFAGCASSEPATEAAPKMAAQEPRPMADAPARDASRANAAEPAAAANTGKAGPELAMPVAATETPTKTPDVIYVPTPQPVVDKMLELAKLKKSDVVYDLGCGDGRIVVTAAKKYGTRAFGFDIDPQRVSEARDNVRKNGVEDLVTIEQKDIFTLDLSPASVVTLYLLPELNVRLIPQLEKLKSGARIVSHDFDMAGVKPARQLSLKPDSEQRSHQIYFWTTPLKKTADAT